MKKQFCLQVAIHLTFCQNLVVDMYILKLCWFDIYLLEMYYLLLSIIVLMEFQSVL